MDGFLMDFVEFGVLSLVNDLFGVK